MHPTVDDLLTRVKNPQYTGDNRCGLCTVVNVGIALIIGGAIAVVTIEIAVAWIVLAVAAIYFRGYLVPGTPRLTKRYAPHWLLERTDHGEVDTDDDGPVAAEDLDIVQRIKYEREHAVDPDAFLTEHDVIVDRGRKVGLRLTDSFQEHLDPFMRDYRDDPYDPTGVARLFACDPEDIERKDSPTPRLSVDNWIRNWPSDQALHADVALFAALEEWIPDWSDVPEKQRWQLVAALRGLVEDCPACGSDLDAEQEWTKVGCCIEENVEELWCPDCDAVIRSSNKPARGERQFRNLM